MSQAIPTKEKIIEVLKTIEDPELHLDIWTLGLVYEINIKSHDEINFVITYTTPMCPFGPAIKQKIREEMNSLGFGAIDIEVAFDPPWEPSEELRTALGI